MPFGIFLIPVLMVFGIGIADKENQRQAQVSQAQVSLATLDRQGK